MLSLFQSSVVPSFVVLLLLTSPEYLVGELYCFFLLVAVTCRIQMADKKIGTEGGGGEAKRVLNERSTNLRALKPVDGRVLCSSDAEIDGN